MKASEFSYQRARSVTEALQFKADHGDGGRWLAGGQSLLAALAFRLSEPTALIDISRLPELQEIEIDGGVVRIGAGTTHAVLGASDVIRKRVPLLAAAVPEIAHVAVRNRGTIGGSLAFADPAAELPACCVALDATLVAVGPNGERRIAAREFFHGVYATALDETELLTAIEVPMPAADQRQALTEIGRRSGDYAMAGVAVVLRGAPATVTGARVVFFALGDRPVVAEHAERELGGKALDAAAIERAVTAALADLDPAGDLNGGPATKRHLAQVVLRRALTRIMNDGVQTAA